LRTTISVEVDNRHPPVEVHQAGISVKALQYGKAESASGGMVRQIITIQQGISKEKGKDINAVIKETKLKSRARYRTTR